MPEWKDSPDKAGWWWWKGYSTATPEMIPVRLSRKGGMEMFDPEYPCDATGGIDWQRIVPGRWYGPIPEPPEDVPNDDDYPEASDCMWSPGDA